MSLIAPRLLLLGLLPLLLGAAITPPTDTPTQPEPDAFPYRIVGYFGGWSIYERGYFVTDIPAEHLTHINYAFANLSPEGEVILGDPYGDTQFAYPGEEPDETRLLGNFNQLNLLKQDHPHLQTLISIGGWSWSDYFSDAALTPDSRERFARSAVDFMLRYGFDGIDLDWEYPTGNGEPGNIQRPQDAENFVLLLEAVRAALDAQSAQDNRPSDRPYLLTIAIGAGEAQINGLDWGRIHPLLDWINVMTYDMSGAWSAVTGFHAPLYRSGEEGSTHTSLLRLRQAGVPPRKIVMGVPFYGLVWSGVGATNNGWHQPFDSVSVVDYRLMEERYMGQYARFVDATAQAPWWYDAETETMVVFDDPETLALKAAYVRDNHLGGMMFWQLSGDNESHALLTAIAEGLRGE